MIARASGGVLSSCLLSVWFLSPGLASETFVRGDANGDGTVSLSDSIFLAGHFFQGAAAPPTADAADANDDSLVSLTDMLYITRFIALGGPQPPAPYPDPGVDPTLLEPPEAASCNVFRVGEVSAPSAGSRVTVPVFMTYRATEDSPLPVSAYVVSFRFDPSYLTLQLIDISGSPVEGYDPLSVAPQINNHSGQGRLAVIISEDETVGLLPREEVVIANLTFSVDAVAPVPPYHTTIEIADNVLSPPLVNEMTIGGTAVRPRLVGGRVWIQGPPFVRGDINGNGEIRVDDSIFLLNYFLLGGRAPDDLDAGDVNDDGMLSFSDALCLINFLFSRGSPPAPPFPDAGLDPTRDAPPPRTPGDVLRVCREDLCVGEPSVVRIRMTNSVPIVGFTISLAYDPKVLDVTGARLAAGLAPPSVNPDIIVDETRGRILASARFDDPIPFAFDRPVLEIEIVAASPVETFTWLCFEDFFHFPFLPNELLRAGSCAVIRPRLESGRLTTASCQPFIRGDFNGDGAVDLADPVAALGHMLRSGAPPADRFAADANDDGRLTLADVNCLNALLFLGARDELPPPFPTAGVDTTPACPPRRESCIAFDLESGTASPGSSIALNVSMTYSPLDPLNARATGYVAALAYDPLFLELQSASLPANITALEPITEVKTDAIRGHVRFIVTFSPDNVGGGIPPADNIPIGVLNFLVRPVPPGQPRDALVRFADDLFDPSLPNEVVVGCESIRPLLDGGGINISGNRFVRGDASGDLVVDASDAAFILDHLFRNGGPLPSRDAADLNDDGMVSMLDPTCLLFHLFEEGPEPAAPFPARGLDPTTPSTPPPPSTLDSFTIPDGDLCRGVDNVVPVLMTTVSPVEGFVVSISYDPEVVDIVTVRIAPGLPPVAQPDVIDVVPGQGRITVAHAFASPVPPGAGRPIVEIVARPLQFPRRFTYFCFRDGPTPGFVVNEIVSFTPACSSTRPTLRSGRYAAVTKFKRGDCNQDNRRDLSDGVTILNCLFTGLQTVCFDCLDACDANDDERVNLSDAVCLLRFLFLGTCSVSQPYPACGKDPTPTLGLPFCEYPHCD